MKKHITLFLCLFAITATSVAPIMGAEFNSKPIAGITEDMYSIIGNATDYAQLQQDKIEEAQQKIDSVDRNNTIEWFKNYRAIQNEYSEWIDADETIYDYFNADELELLFKIVETEVREDKNFDEKVNVVNVIFNRIEHEDFPVDLTEVLTEYPQFSSYLTGAYKNIEVTETTRLACEYAFQFSDTTYGALYFDSTNGHSWADQNREYIFTDAIGHSFYR